MENQGSRKRLQHRAISRRSEGLLRSGSQKFFRTKGKKRASAFRGIGDENAFLLEASIIRKGGG